MFNILETIVLVLINSASISLIIILLANSLENKQYKWLTVLTISIMGWVNFAYLGYVELNPSLSFSFYKINGAFVALFLFAEYIFYFEGILKKSWPVIRFIVLVICTIFALLFLFTDLIISGVTWKGWGNEVTFQFGYEAFGLFSMLMNMIIVVLLVNQFVKLKTSERRKIVFFLLGTFLFIALNIIFNIISPVVLQTARFQHLGDYSAVLFLAFTSFAILRRQFLNVRVALTAFLISIVSTLLLIDIFALSRNLLEQVIKLGLLSFFVVISILLVRSVLNEIKQREEVARINNELRKVNTALDNALSEVQEVRRKERDMMDVMGHELRTPLTVVRNALSLIQKEIRKSGKISLDKLNKYLDMALESARREVQLVETLLSATKVDASRLQLNMVKVRVSEVIRDAVESQRNIIEEKKLVIDYPTLNGELFVFTDRIRVQEIMDNLLSNAVKYTEKGEIQINVWSTKGKIWIQIKDSGYGINSEDLENLGKKFFRAKQHVHGKGMVRPGGTGLGLYVTFELIRIMGGQLYIQSEAGRGSMFTFGLPEFTNQEEHHFDQTFDAGNMDNRQHVFLNEEPPAA